MTANLTIRGLVPSNWLPMTLSAHNHTCFKRLLIRMGAFETVIALSATLAVRLYRKISVAIFRPGRAQIPIDTLPCFYFFTNVCPSVSNTTLPSSAVFGIAIPSS